MNKKGFVFVETIVTLTVLMSLLVVLYSIFVNLLQKEKTRVEYDKYSDKMALFYYKEYLGDAKIKGLSEIYRTSNGKKHYGARFYDDNFGLDLTNNDGADTGYPCNVAIMPCSMIENNTKKTRLSDLTYLTTTNALNPSDKWCSGGASRDFESFRDQIAVCPSFAQYVILGEFKHKEGNKTVYSYAHIYYPNYQD